MPYDSLPVELKTLRSVNTDNARELQLSNGSTLRVGTSMRSCTLQLLHVSEFGKICAKFPDKAREIVTGSLNALAPGQFFKNIKDYSDLRASSLNVSLAKAHSLQTEFRAKKIFLIAGAAHLKRATRGIEQTKIDQSAFYSFLNTRKTVILFPKGLNTRLASFS